MNKVCNICGGETSKIFDALVLGKYTVDYLQCKSCGFIQTEKPYWLKEAYVSAITSIDVGLIYRNLSFSATVPAILDMFSTKGESYIDYGGGYGMFVRIMRDKGYDFYLHDIYAENMFAKYFELKDFSGDGKFAALTAFEVFEHLEDPLNELEKMFELSDTIIFSTALQPRSGFTSAEDWWYFTPETGQHIAFYNTQSLEIISKKYNCHLYSNKSDLHILTRRKLSADPFEQKPGDRKTIFQRIANRLAGAPREIQHPRETLLEQDFQLYRNKINGKS